ncbi:hypothetical protein JTB14_016595 [Gonioctena quinquepunctata]|nr:hypothetical protein JTB14_016595 [Gonioctena quinquepunctata]
MATVEVFSRKNKKFKRVRFTYNVYSVSSGNCRSKSHHLYNFSMVLGPSRKRAHARAPLRKNALSYLNEKSEREYRIKNRELELHERKMEEHKLALEERRVKLDESRLELEKEERMHKIELEKQLTLTVN